MHLISPAYPAFFCSWQGNGGDGVAEIRRDPITGRWIIVSTDNPMGPEDFPVEEHKIPAGTCPFCPGNESMTPPQITIRRSLDGSQGASWSFRVVPNKFPALQIEGDLNRRGEGIYDMMNGVGAHEVIIETPDHHKELADFSAAEMGELFSLFKERSLDLKKDARLRYLLIFKNFGESAGASLSHPHSQLIATPIVPKRVVEELKRSQVYFDQKERCLFCDVIHQEMAEKNRIVFESDSAVAFAPFVSRFPFELWLLPKQHLANFMDSSQELLTHVGDALRQVLGKIRATLHNPSYNFLIHTSPLEAIPPEGYHWHLELIPRLTRVAGFEWGSGFYINPTPPELAAHHLQS